MAATDRAESITTPEVPVGTAISDLTIRSIQEAMRGLGTQRRTIAHNVANSETPGYLAKRVSFQESLAQAIGSGRPESMRTTLDESIVPPNQTGNNVSVDEEFVDLTENQLAQQLAVEALNAKYRLLRTAITGV
jgi:flagellar basal-body rod protein FlgB